MENVAFDLLRHEAPAREAGIDLSRTMLVSRLTAESRVYRRILADVAVYRVAYAVRSSEAQGGDALIAALASKQIRGANAIKKWPRLDEADAIEPDETAHKRYLEYFERVWSQVTRP